MSQQTPCISRVRDLAAIRRDIHRHPELAFEETRTATLVAEKLRDWRIDVTTGIGGTGVVGRIVGQAGGRVIGLRADMDALPIVETTGLAYASTRPGVMHACGHDGHTAMLLGAARELAEARDFTGIVNLIFQPAEEGGRGARAMIADALFDRFPCDALYGLHNWPGLASGHIAVRPGPVMANCDRWRVIFRGSGGHGGSNPHLATDVTVRHRIFLHERRSARIVSVLIRYQETDTVGKAPGVPSTPDPPNAGHGKRGQEGHLAYLLRQGAGAVRLRMERLLADLGVTTAQFAVLTMLDAYPHASGADVARLALLTPQTVHGITGNLRRAGLVKAAPSANHGRIKTLALTTAGQELLATCKARVAALEQDLAVGLTDGKEEVIRRWLVRLALPRAAE